MVREILRAQGSRNADVVVGISGERNHALRAWRAEIRAARGAVTVGVTSNPRSPLARAAQYRHRARYRARSHRRLDAAEGRHRAENGAEPALYRFDGAHRQSL